MAVLVRPRAWGQQKPSLGSSINWGHPLAAGLLDLYLFNEQAGQPRSLVNGVGSTRQGGAVSDPRGLVVPGSGDYLAITPKIVTLTQATWLVYAAFSLGQAFSGIYYDRTTNPGGLMYVGSGPGSGTALGYTWNNDAATWGWDSSLTAPADGIRRIHAVTVSPSTSTVYVGTKSASQAYAAPSFSWGGGGAIGTDTFDTAARNTRGVYYLAAMWNRALTASEIAWLNVEPYAFINPPAPRARFVAVLGTQFNQTLTATQTQTPTMIRSVGHIVPTASNSQTPTIIKSVGHKMTTATQTQTASRGVLQTGKNVAATQTQTATQGPRTIAHTTTVTHTQTPSFVKSIPRTLTAVQTQSASLVAAIAQLAKGLAGLVFPSQKSGQSSPTSKSGQVGPSEKSGGV